MLTCKNPMQTFAGIKEGVPVTIRYILKNESTETLNLKPSSSCGCSTPTLPKSQITPDEEMIMTVVFDSLGKKGVSEKSVFVSYDLNGAQKRLTLKFIASVE